MQKGTQGGSYLIWGLKVLNFCSHSVVCLLRLHETEAESQDVATSAVSSQCSHIHPFYKTLDMPMLESRGCECCQNRFNISFLGSVHAEQELGASCTWKQGFLECCRSVVGMEENSLACSSSRGS